VNYPSQEPPAYPVVRDDGHDGAQNPLGIIFKPFVYLFQ